MLAKWIVLAGMATNVSAQTSNSQILPHAQAAQEAEQRNDFQTAVQEYSYVVHLLPHDAQMQSNLGVALYFDHEYQRAISVFHKAIEIQPALLAPHLFTGLAWSRLSNPDRAVPELQKAVHIQASDPLAHAWLGYAYVAQHHYDAAAKEFDLVSQIDPKNIDVWYALGQSYLQIGDDATEELLSIAPESGRTWQLAGEQCLLRNDSANALEDFQRANVLRPDIADVRSAVVSMGGTPTPVAGHHPSKDSEREDALYREAHEAEQKARLAYQYVVDLAPDSYRAHQILADSYVAAGRTNDAISEYLTVLSLKPELPGIHQTLGNLLLGAGKLPQALEEFRAEVQLQPGSAEANMNVGRALLMMGKDEEATRALTDALHLDRPPLETWLLLGKLYVRERKPQEAITMLQYFIDHDQQTSTAYFLLASAYRQTGNKEEMDKAIVSYKQTSLDVKQRSMAQRQLEASAKGMQEDKALAEDSPQPE
jgi:tetratricopeptide (TPR) repeat protein